MYAIGDFVKINNTNLNGKIINIINKKNMHLYKININNKILECDENQIQKAEPFTPQYRNFKNAININYNYSNNFIPEIMIRHENLDIAMFNVENFVNEAIINNCKEIKIIHGRHGGILRNGVHEYLKHNKNVESFRLGNYFEGSYGVTIIKLK